MARPQDANPEDLRSIERKLELDLAILQRDLHTLLSGEEAPLDAAFESEFGRSVARIEKTIGGLRRAVDRLSVVGAVNLSTIADKVLSELLLVTEKPLVLRVEWDPQLPQVLLPVEAAHSVVARTLTLMMRYLQPGDCVALRTFVENEEIVLRADVTFDDPYGNAAWFEDLNLRASSLSEFIGELGGSFSLNNGESLRLELRFRTTARVP
ncbi:MAG: hypothetical protein AB7I19_04190 [Planctomycetota bacterium]